MQPDVDALIARASAIARTPDGAQMFAAYLLLTAPIDELSRLIGFCETHGDILRSLYAATPPLMATVRDLHHVDVDGDQT